MTPADYDVVLDDLRDLVRALGWADVARPVSPHDVMRQCIDEVARLRTERCACPWCRGELKP